MGREASCQCQWGKEVAECKVLLETHDLIVRGPIRQRVPIASLTQVTVEGSQLRFCAGEDEVALHLGAAVAQSWAKKIATPPPTLAAKLGISKTTRLALIGEVEAEELKSAIGVASSSDGKIADLIIACVKTKADLNYTLDAYSTYPDNPPIWLIYPKGSDKPLKESEIRSTLRHEGLMDTKVTSVNQTLTGLRFIKRL
jgi:hypothetical protein